MTKTHLTSLTYDQNITENLTNWPKITSKPKNNAKKPSKMAKNDQNSPEISPK